MSGTVTHLFRYPVKSMGGHSLSSTPLTVNGIPGDRAWALKDEERGGIKGGKRFPELLSMSASFVSEPTAQHVSPDCLLYTSPSPRDRTRSRMPSSA